MSDTSNWLGEMTQLLDPNGITQSPEEMAPWLTDWRGRYTGSAIAMVSPKSTEQVSEIVKIAAKNKISLVPQGGNSGMVGGATPDKSGKSLIVSLRRMNRIRDIFAEDGLVVCDAGVVLQNLHEALAEHEQRFPLTLGGKGSATVGGLVSTNAGGTQVLRHGAMRSLVAGLEAVLPDGSIFDGLAALKKDNRGYDLKQLLIGGEGTLGIVTAATLKTVPSIVDRCVAWVGIQSPQDAYELFKFLKDRENRTMEGFEIVPAGCLDAVLRHIPGTRAPLEAKTAWNALIEIVQDKKNAPNPSRVMEKLLAEAFDADLLLDATIASSESQAEAFWKIRDSISEAERTDGPALQHDISVPVSKMADFITDSAPKIEKCFEGTQVLAFGHMGDGNVHFHVKAPQGASAAAWTDEFSRKITPMVHDLIVEAGGSISAEHGIGQSKNEELARLSDDARLMALQSIKAALDPHYIMNPGKLVPLASRRPPS